MDKVRLCDAETPAALLERLALPADPDHRRGHRQAGPADPRARRGLPRHHRRAPGRAPLRRAPARPTPRRSSATSRRSPTRRSARPRTPTRRICAPTRSAAPAWSASTTRSCAARPASPATRSTTSAASSARPRADPAEPGANLVTSIDARVQRVAEYELNEAMKDARKQYDRNTGDELQGRLRRGRRDGGQDRPRRRHGLQPDVRPERLGRRHLRQGLHQAHRQEVQLPAAEPRDPGPVGARLHLQGGPDGRRGQRRLLLQRPLRLLQLVLHRRPGLQELRVPELRPDQPRPRPGGLLRHRLLRASPTRSGSGTAASSPKKNAKDWFYKTAHQFGLGKETGIDLPNEVTGRIPDRQWKQDYWKANKDAWCKYGKKDGTLRRADRVRELPRRQPDARR